MSRQPTEETKRNLPQPGQVLAGKFRVERVLGAGGMGVVVAAHHMHLDRRVALKFLLPELNPTPTVVTRFAREAKAAARIQSEHVARVIDVGTLETGAPYMVMEYLEGRDLGEELQSSGRIALAQAVDWLLQACEAIAEAHAAGIVHRDLKPGNLFLTRRADGSPLVKVLDFGISKHLLVEPNDPAGGAALTQTMAQLGSPAYMSPEQLKSSKDVDARTDIWALALILQEMLTGEIAFSATSIVELHVAILTKPPLSLRAKRPDVPDTIEQVVARCLEKEPDRRYQNLAELAAALAPFGTEAARRSAQSIARVLGVALPSAPARPGPTVAEAPAHVGVASTTTGQGYPAPGPATQASTGASAGYGAYPGTPMGGPAVAPTGGGYGGAGPGHAGPMGPTGYGAHPSPYGHGPMMAPPGAMGVPYGAPAGERGTSTTVIVLVVVLATIVAVMGGCVLCVCISAAHQSDRAHDDVRARWAALPIVPWYEPSAAERPHVRRPECHQAPGPRPIGRACALDLTSSALTSQARARRRRPPSGARRLLRGIGR